MGRRRRTSMGKSTLKLKFTRCLSRKRVPWGIKMTLTLKLKDWPRYGANQIWLAERVFWINVVMIGPNLTKIHLSVTIPLSTISIFRMTWYNVPFQADYWEKIEVRWVGEFFWSTHFWSTYFFSDQVFPRPLLPWLNSRVHHFYLRVCNRVQKSKLQRLIFILIKNSMVIMSFRKSNFKIV